jgi:hypothetical protein
VCADTANRTVKRADKRVSPSWQTDQIQAVHDSGYAAIFGGSGAAIAARKNELVRAMRQSAERYARELAAS